MEDIIKKRTDLMNFFKHENNTYDKKEILYREYTVLSFSPRDEFIDVIETPFDKFCVDLSTFTFENTTEFYMKAIITDVDRQNHQTILHVRNKDISVSVVCRDGASRIYDDYFIVGEPVIIKGSVFAERVYLGFLIALNHRAAFFNEQRYILGNSFNAVQRANEDELDSSKYAVIVECKWVKTSTGKDMLRGTLYDGDGYKSFGTMKNSFNRVVPKDLKAGDFVMYPEPTHDFFINNMRIVML